MTPSRKEYLYQLSDLSENSHTADYLTTVIKKVINDIGKDIPDAVIADNDLKIVKAIHDKCPQTKVYVESVLPVNSTIKNFPQHYDKEEHVLVLNKLLKANATVGNYTYVDIFHLFVDADGRLQNQYSYEGLHLKPPAYDIWVDYLKKQGYL